MVQLTISFRYIILYISTANNLFANANLVDLLGVRRFFNVDGKKQV